MADKKTTEEVMGEMEANAEAAKADFDIATINASPDPVKAVGTWMKRWYLKAGYKRLSRILIEEAEKE